MMHQIVPTLDHVPPTGDHSRDAKAELFDYHRNYLQTLISLFPSDPLAGRAKAMLAASSLPEMENRFMFVYDFLYPNRDVAPTELAGLGTAYHAPGIGQLYARSGWDKSATWVNLIAGPYTESHAHQDQGSFLLYKGEWLAYDPNVETSSGLRYENDLHNLVRITDDGETVEQHEPSTSEVLALAQGDGWFHTAVDSTGSYDGNDRVTRVQREVVFLEPDVVVVFDRVASAAGTQQIWQLSSPFTPVIAGSRATFAGEAHTLRVERVASPTVSTAARDWAQLDDDFHGGHRLDETATGGTNTYLHVLWTDGAATAVTRDDADGRIGATITLAGGGTATVRFSATGVDGTLELGGDSFALDAGVATLPE
jgi:hypothetical protein